MSNTNKQNSLVVLVLLILAGAVAFYAYMSSQKTAHTEREVAVTVENHIDVADEESMKMEDLAELEETTAPAFEETEPVIEDSAEEAISETGKVLAPFSYPFNNSVLSMKALGSENAPVTIMEFSSLSCPHCGEFHKSAYKNIMQEYVDTGKVRLIMIDFPLNLPALQGAALAHCMPEDQYFNFIQLLFTTQESWLLNTNDPLAKLKQSAALAGLSEDEINACLENKAIQDALVERNKKASELYNIQSTPSFIFNDGAAVITGARPFDTFKETIEGLLAKSE